VLAVVADRDVEALVPSGFRPLVALAVGLGHDVVRYLNLKYVLTVNIKNLSISGFYKYKDTI